MQKHCIRLYKSGTFAFSTFWKIKLQPTGDGGPIYILDYRTFFIILSVAFATACPKKFSDLYDGFWSNIHWRFFPPNVPERIVTGSDLIRTQIVIDGGNAAEK